jgi:hypothetical protein
MTIKNADMPAMPCDDVVLRDEDGNLHGCPITSGGLTKREHIAAMAFAEMLRHYHNGVEQGAHDRAEDWSFHLGRAAFEAADGFLLAGDEKND